MTATTSRGVLCGNCSKYHPSAKDVRACYLATGDFRQVVKSREHLIESHDDQHHLTQRRGKALSQQINSRWDGSNTQRSPVARKPMTEKQALFIRSLRQERGINVNDPIPGGSTKQAASEYIEELLHQPKVAAKSDFAFADVPAGHYAISSLTGNNDLDFFRVDHSKSGRVYVKRIIGGHPNTNMRWSEAMKVLAVLKGLGETGQQEARQRYGQNIGRCYRCNRRLTDETSRQLGIGPDCRSRD